MNDVCLICRKPLENSTDFHPHCSKKFFGHYPPPELAVSLEDLKQYAVQSVLARITVTGVQKKLSLGIEKQGRETRFTIVGLWGNFILKPPVDEYPFLPENEDTIMRLASVCGIPVVPHALIRLASGECSYISRRIDRTFSGEKYAMEDFCQISGRMTEDKYKGSVERVGKLLRRFSVYPGLDAVDFFERVVVNFICGNADMHLKNYSLLETAEGMRLSPAYDFVSTALVLPDDPEESALTINGKKNRLSRTDFDLFARTIGIPEPVSVKVYRKLRGKLDKMLDVVHSSFLPEWQQQTLSSLIGTRLNVFVP